MVEFGAFPKLGGYSEHYFGLLQDLKALFDGPVDVLVGRAVRNPYLLETINQTRESLFAARLSGNSRSAFPKNKE